MQHLFLTGDRQVGKSTLLKKWLAQIDISMSGFYTRKCVSEDGHLFVHMLAAGKEDWPTSDNILFNCRERDLAAASERFNQLGCPLLHQAENTQLIMMDEIGIMEEQAGLFREAVLHTLDGGIPVIGVFHAGNSSTPPSASPSARLTAAFSISARSARAFSRVIRRHLQEGWTGLLRPGFPLPAQEARRWCRASCRCCHSCQDRCHQKRLRRS